MKLLCLLLPLVLVASEDDFSIGSRLFTGDVYNQILLDNNDNILVSPFSAETIFALTQSGAEGQTGNEIRSTLHLPDTKEDTEKQIKAVLPTIKSEFVSVNTANKIYVENDFTIKENFKKVARDVYAAEFENIEFAESESAADTINQWVKDQTNGKIEKLLESDELDENTKVVLINALYFQGNWSIPFDPYFTTKAKFYSTGDKVVETTMMYKESERFNYYEDEDLDAQILEMPFEGGDASMTIVLPKQREGIALLEKQMRNVLMTPKYTQENVEVIMPKFKIESTIDFKQVLQELGVKRAFVTGQADFSGIAGEAGELFIAHAKQKTYIDVNEVGVEAAAVTEIGGFDSIPPKATKSVQIDHPFVFYIKVNDIILFEGRVLVPEE